MIATVHVCTSCQTRDAVRRAAGDEASEALIAALRHLLPTVPGSERIGVERQGCFGPCGPGVRIAVTGPGRWGWLFEGLELPGDLDAFATFLRAWSAAPDGVLGKADRPARLLRRTVGRVPPSSA